MAEVLPSARIFGHFLVSVFFLFSLLWFSDSWVCTSFCVYLLHRLKIRARLLCLFRRFCLPAGKDGLQQQCIHGVGPVSALH